MPFNAHKHLLIFVNVCRDFSRVTKRVFAPPLLELGLNNEFELSQQSVKTLPLNILKILANVFPETSLHL